MANAHEEMIAVAEAAYRLGGDDDAWLARVLSAAAPSMDRGLGVFACFFEPSADAKIRFRDPVDAGTALPLRAIFEPLGDRLEPSLVRRLFVYGPVVASVLDLLGWGYLSAEEVALGRGVLAAIHCRDLMAVRVYEPSRRLGLLIVAPLGRDARVPAPEVGRWERLAGHLAAGLRLRLLFGRGDESAALRKAATAVEAIEDRMRREPPERAIALWKGLVSGKWSLVDHFDAQGRRYIVARRNDPDVLDPRALTEREERVALELARGRGNKEIAYELGLSAATVAQYARRVQRKLGFRSRVELVDFLGQLRVHLIETNPRMPPDGGSG